MVKHHVADLFDTVQQSLDQMGDRDQAYQAELSSLRQAQKETDKKHKSTDDRLQDVENYVSGELENAGSSILENADKIAALESLVGKYYQACNFPTTPFAKSELKLQKKVSALEERLSDFINQKDEHSVVGYESNQVQHIKALYEVRENEVFDLDYRVQALTVHVNNIQSSVDTIEASNETREDEMFHLRRYMQDLATKFDNIESLVRLTSNHQSLLKELVDVQQHSHNFRHDHIAMKVSTPSLIEEIPELSGHVFGAFTSAYSQIPSGQFHCDSDVLVAPLLVEDDSPLIDNYGSAQNQGSGHRSRGSPAKDTHGLLECNGLIDPEAKAQDALCSDIDDYAHFPSVHFKLILARRAHLGYRICLFERSPRRH
ncbi:hypothetical protein HYPSUDRAFT_201782 [Hypholoma sublateritium FD-334 SS-4]|uniref:Uncharacterized protein n=1 Tax=Hypholoma sublateritium (strain FD-334 SS-4) TaxID=945553 RepID=A0A0D2L792_HYPSF|nr:hypothetical protein HYPSUDRAFT_201782 [Hypholoma sublateritium FD-334 SS-4]